MFNWTVFDTPSEHCVMRIRYNISTGDYQGWNGANASHNYKRNSGKRLFLVQGFLSFPVYKYLFSFRDRLQVSLLILSNRI